MTTELNQHLDSLVSMITVMYRKHLQKPNIYGSAAIPKPLVTGVNAKRRLQRCHTHKTWFIEKNKKVTWSDKSSLSLTLSYNRTGAHLEDTSTSVLS
ncbi:hypothetical protein TNCV_1938191 [Trichonephila clavipes]|nr:hypothetical protein TNCV_1938191 [Trichonephila clavipes]